MRLLTDHYVIFYGGFVDDALNFELRFQKSN